MDKMLKPSPEQFIRPFLLYGGLVFTIIRRAVIVGMVLLFLHLFVVTVVPVRGASMDPTLADGAYILVDQLTPRLRPLSRGEIVAFRYPQDPKQKFIKRLIGLPNDIITVRDEQVLLQRPGDEQPIRLREPYLSLSTTTEGDIAASLGPVEYFMMGDNRLVSFDSRFFGDVSESLVLGRAWIAIWPLGGLRLISHFDPLTASQ